MKTFLGFTLAIALMIIGVRDSQRSPDLAPPLTVTEPIVITVAPEPAQPAECDIPRINPQLVDAAEKTTLRKVERPAVAVPKDGQLSPQKQWRWSAKAWKWQPVKVAKAYPLYGDKPRGGEAFVDPPEIGNYINHLVNDHGVDLAYATWLSQQPNGGNRLFALHSDIHFKNVVSSQVVWDGNCPNGQCKRPAAVRAPAYQPRGLFRRR
jgi:hypothetical protein